MHTLHPTTTFPQHADDHWGPFVLQLCEAIARQDVGVEVLAANTPDAEPFEAGCDVRRFDYFFGDRFQTLMTPPGLIPNMKHRPWRIVQLPFFYRALANNIRDRSQDADLVHAHWLIPTGFAAVRNTDVPVLATVWGAEYHVNPDGLLGRLVHHTQERADHLVAVSDYLRERGIEVFDCDPDRISVIPNAVDTGMFRSDVDSDIRAAYDIPANDVLVTTVRRLVEEKRVDDLIAAAATVVEDREDVTVLIVGDGPERPALERQAREEGVEDNIVFTGALPHDDIPAVMAASDVFVLSTEQEGMATALLEAMAGGAVPIATAGTGNDEVVVDGESGLLYETGDTDALAEGIMRLVTRPDTRRRMADAARHRAEDKFSYETVAQEYVDLYKKLI